MESQARSTEQSKSKEGREEITSSRGRLRNSVAKWEDEVKNQGECTDANTANSHTRRSTGGAYNKGTGLGEKVKGHSSKQKSHFKGATESKGRSARANHAVTVQETRQIKSPGKSSMCHTEG